MEQSTKVNGVMTNNKVLELKHGQMERDMKDNIKEDKKMVIKKNNLGKGIFTWSDGSRYEGEFDHNNIHGKGIYKWGDGR